MYGGYMYSKIKNIALTGPYGSGKSSIIKSFENEFLDFDWACETKPVHNESISITKCLYLFIKVLFKDYYNLFFED